MTREELEKRLESAEKQMIGLQDEIQNLTAKLAEVQDEPKIPDFPEFTVGDDYYPHIRWESTPRKHTVDCLHEEFCKKPLTVEMNYFHFHSAEYYHYFESKCKLIAMMLHCKWYCDKEVVTDFSDDALDKWCVWYDHFSDEWSVDSQLTHESTTVYFTTEEAAQKCAEWMNEHWRDSE